MCKKIFLTVIFLWFGLTALPEKILAQDQTLNTSENFKAKITKVIEEKQVEVEGGKQWYQKLELIALDGEIKGKKFIVENGNVAMTNTIKYDLNERLVVSKQTNPEGKDVYNIVDVVRTDSLLLLGVIFLILTVAVARVRGLASIVSMVLSFLVIYYFLLPRISDGQDPVLVTILASMVIIPITFYMSHGISKKTNVAIVGTLIALIITGIMANIFINIGRLSGLSSEESGFLLTMKQGGLNMKGLLLAGIVIGALGVLDDITVAQAGIVQQLRNASEKMKFGEIYSSAMKVGQDHIASMINTLILVYAGASLPLLLIFIDNPHPFSEIINYEFLAEEIIRTLVGSTGLILAVPITTLIAAAIFSKKTK